MIGSRQKMVTDIMFTLFDQEEVLKNYKANERFADVHLRELVLLVPFLIFKKPYLLCWFIADQKVFAWRCR